MTQIGEGIAVAQIRLEKNQCIFCGKDEHENKKKDTIKPTGWKRPKEFKGVGGRFSKVKLSLYPNDKSPTISYKAEGHHCLAFSSFITGAQAKPKNPQDRFAVLNHYLNEKGYDPSNINNCIDLPGRKENGDKDPAAQFVEYGIALEENKPLQLHIGGHAGDFMDESILVLRDLVRTMQQRSLCSKPDDEFKNHILKKINEKEDRAFKMTASVTSPWICHPVPLKKAEKWAKKVLNIDTITYPNL